MHYFQLYLSGTKATPEQRRDAIHWMLCSDDASIRKLGAEALRTTLATRNFVGSGYTTMTFGALIAEITVTIRKVIRSRNGIGYSFIMLAT